MIAYPTESCFGLGCDPNNSTALRRLLALKQRPASKGLILIAATFAQFKPFLRPVSETIKQKLDGTWPGPVTWLLPAEPSVSELLRGEHDTLAVRVTDHPLAAKLCEEFGGAIVSTSANVSGQKPARTVLDVQQQWGEQLDYIVPGELGNRDQPSEIRNALTDEVVREGVK